MVDRKYLENIHSVIAESEYIFILRSIYQNKCNNSQKWWSGQKWYVYPLPFVQNTIFSVSNGTKFKSYSNCTNQSAHVFAVLSIPWKLFVPPPCNQVSTKPYAQWKYVNSNPTDGSNFACGTFELLSSLPFYTCVGEISWAFKPPSSVSLTRSIPRGSSEAVCVNISRSAWIRETVIFVGFLIR